VGFDVVTGDDSMRASTGDREADGEDGADEEDKNTRFLTYEEPGDVDDDFDVDRDAVRQFVDEYCEVDLDAGKKVKLSREELFNAFINWSEMNGLSLNRLHESIPDSTRKRVLKETLTDIAGVDTGRPKINGKKTSAYYSINMTDSGYDLLKTE